MDSTHSKVSNGVLFVIFGRRDQKIWIIKVLYEIWFEIPIWITFKSGADTWSYLIRRYHFRRIKNWGRWILLDLDAPDRPVPVRYVNFSGAYDEDPMDQVQKGELTVGI
jgi:hypothetical protein